MAQETGGISVQTEHIFPIIKKWLYSEKEIFLREIVSNACDAVTKLRRLSSLGEVRDIADDFRITVRIDEENGTLTVSDNGIGMNADEVRRYICQMALSGALDFVEKYEGKDAASDGIIGHFGLGFYSSFMVSDTVEVETRSFDGSAPVHWVCTEDGNYEISDGTRETRGTDVIMHINDDEKEYLSESKIRDILRKYCSFMPVEIYLEVAGKETEAEDADKTADEQKDGAEAQKPLPINDTHPLWLKQPSECTEEDYRNFYSRVFADYREPLFHIHINADYPLNFKGILYFPRITNEYENMEGQVKLYYNQVFVADNIKEVIPEYLLMLKGVLDCPELPLNVSRSYLQNSGYVAKISAHIVKKVCDKLNGMFNTDRPAYEKLWNDIKIFAEYASLRDRKFYDRVKDSILLPTTRGTYFTVAEYLEQAKDKHADTVYYCTDPVAQAQYVSMFEKEEIPVVRLDKMIDTQFISLVEDDRKIHFVRIDADVAAALKGDGEAYENKELADLFREVSGQEKMTVKFENLRDTSLPCLLNVSEQSRRVEDMMKMYRMTGGEGGADTFPVESTLILNSANSMIRRLGENPTDEKAKRVAKQIYTLALISQRQLSAQELEQFLSDSYNFLNSAF